MKEFQLFNDESNKPKNTKTKQYIILGIVIFIATILSNVASHYIITKLF